VNCRECQKKISESLASGEDSFSSDVFRHCLACAECREFWDTQAAFFGAIDAGVRSVVNETVPASLLPGVRSRLAEESFPSRRRFPSWGLAAVVAVAVLAAGLGYFTHEANRVSSSSAEMTAVPAGTNESPPAKKTPATPVNTLSARVKKHANPPALPEEVSLEVIVSPEERRAFAQFVAQLPEQEAVVVALTRPAPLADAPVQIAPLEFGSVEIKPLESEARE
jgi:hypothetical protein